MKVQKEKRKKEIKLKQSLFSKVRFKSLFGKTIKIGNSIQENYS